MIYVSCWTQDQHETRDKALLVRRSEHSGPFIFSCFCLSCCPTDCLTNRAFFCLIVSPDGYTNGSGYLRDINTNGVETAPHKIGYMVAMWPRFDIPDQSGELFRTVFVFDGQLEHIWAT